MKPYFREEKDINCYEYKSHSACEMVCQKEKYLTATVGTGVEVD